MKKLNTIKTTVLVGLLGAVLAGGVFAKDAPASASIDAVSLKQAVSIAKKHTKAEPIEAEREIEMNQAFYEITSINAQGQEVNTVINASTGEVVFSRLDNDRDDEHGHDNDDLIENAAWLAGVKNGSIKSLNAVIDAAEQAHNAKVFEIEFEDDHGFIKKQMAYELALVDASGNITNLDVSAQIQ